MLRNCQLTNLKEAVTDPRIPAPLPKRVMQSMLDTEITCPECGLVLRVRDDGAVILFNYAMSEWQRRCERRDLGDPIWCLLQLVRTRTQKKN